MQSELEKVFPLQDTHLYLSLNFYVCNYFINHHRQITTQVKYKTMLVLN